MEKKCILDKLYMLKNPYTLNFLSDNDIKELIIDNKNIILTMYKMGNDFKLNAKLDRELRTLIINDLGYDNLKINIENRTLPKLKANKKVIAIMSGKGGVGKSNVTVGISKALASKGYKVGIIDFDVYGYSIAKLLDLYEEPKIENNRIIPLSYGENIKVMSSQYFIKGNKNEPIMWKIAKVHQLLNYIVFNTKWEELDYIIIDTPPSTGDILLNLNHYFDNINTIIVSTPQEDALHVSVRSITLAKELNFNILGIVENMSYFMHNGEQINIFGNSRIDSVCNEYKLNLLGKVPISYGMEEEYNKIIDKVEKE